MLGNLISNVTNWTNELHFTTTQIYQQLFPELQEEVPTEVEQNTCNELLEVGEDVTSANGENENVMEFLELLQPLENQLEQAVLELRESRLMNFPDESEIDEGQSPFPDEDLLTSSEDDYRNCECECWERRWTNEISNTESESED
ncbi:hypothetical protein SNEBB_005876 [Seison nebaliae]|nr:hypothetical protein SNEBB_005876 [Seison nebaliae]